MQSRHSKRSHQSPAISRDCKMERHKAASLAEKPRDGAVCASRFASKGTRGVPSTSREIDAPALNPRGDTAYDENEKRLLVGRCEIERRNEVDQGRAKQTELLRSSGSSRFHLSPAVKPVKWRFRGSQEEGQLQITNGTG